MGLAGTLTDLAADADRRTTALLAEGTAGLRPGGVALAEALVGREPELRLLIERWELAEQGRGQVVLLCGEAGIGKSRLVQALKDRKGKVVLVDIWATT